MSWLAIIVVLICIYLAFKVVGFALKLALWGLVIIAVY